MPRTPFVSDYITPFDALGFIFNNSRGGARRVYEKEGFLAGLHLRERDLKQRATVAFDFVASFRIEFIRQETSYPRAFKRLLALSK